MGGDFCIRGFRARDPVSSRSVSGAPVERDRPFARRALTRLHREPGAGERVLLRRDRRRPLENDRWRKRLVSSDRRKDLELLHRRRGSGRDQPRHHLYRRGRDSASGQHHPGGRRLQVGRRREDLAPHRTSRHPGGRPHPRSSHEPRHRLRLGPRPPLRGQRGARGVPLDRRREHLAEGALQEPEGGRRRPHHRSHQSPGDIRLSLAGLSEGLEDVGRRSGLRPLQVRKRRRHLGRADEKPWNARGSDRKDRSHCLPCRSEAGLGDRGGGRGRRLPLRRRRRHLETNER